MGSYQSFQEAVASAPPEVHQRFYCLLLLEFYPENPLATPELRSQIAQDFVSALIRWVLTLLAADPIFEAIPDRERERSRSPHGRRRHRS